MNCGQCKHMGNLPGESHIECRHPHVMNSGHRLGLAAMVISTDNDTLNRLLDRLYGVTLDAHGVKKGWCFWPMNFDPIWVNSCGLFEKWEPNKETKTEGA